MSAITTDLVAPGSRRLLKPHRVLRRLRPVRLSVAAYDLEESRRTAMALGLIQHFFPERLEESLPTSWIAAMKTFFDLVDKAGWFPIDWVELDDLYDMAMQCGVEDDEMHEPDALYHMSRYLECIPVKYRGLWSERRDGDVDEYPGLAIIAGIFGHIEIDYDDVLTLLDDWPDGLEESDPHLALLRFDPERYEKPLCYLPEAVKYATGQTGSFLLDEASEMTWDRDIEEWRWDCPEDVAALKAAWASVKDLWEKVDRFIPWSGSVENQATIAGVLLGMDIDND